MAAVSETKRISQSIDSYDTLRLQSELVQLGYHMLPFQPVTKSTMSLVEDHLRGGGQTPVVALADHQSQGRGRPGRNWYDEPKASLLFSIGTKLADQTAIGPYANLVALRVCQVLQQVTKKGEVKIKYPNDLTFQGKKLGGFLVENVYDENSRHRYLGTNVGIGINVHYEEDELNLPDFDNPGTALDAITGAVNSREKILSQLVTGIKHLDTDAVIVRNNGQTTENHYDAQWRACSALLDREVVIVLGNGTVVEGHILDTKIRYGLLIQVKGQQSWFSLFDTNTRIFTKEEYGARS